MNAAFSTVEKAAFRLVTVTGDINSTNASEFRAACSSPRPIVVDLLRCTYIDSVGLHELIVANRTRELGLVLTPACRIYRIFAITHLLKHFTIATAVNEASARRSAPTSYLARRPMLAPASP